MYKQNHQLIWVAEDYNGEPENDTFNRPIPFEYIGCFFTDETTIEKIIDMLLRDNQKASYICDTVFSDVLQKNIHNYYHVIG